MLKIQNKKHAAFGKYKGRINNYLSKRGYDLVKERKAWYERIKARGGKEYKLMFIEKQKKELAR